MANKYRTAYVTSNTGHDFSALKSIAEEIRFILTGYENEEGVTEVIKNQLIGFDPALDIVVPVGNVTTSALIGFILRDTLGHGAKFKMAHYMDKEYHVIEYAMGWLSNG